MAVTFSKTGKISNTALIVGGVLLLLLIIGAALILWPQPTPAPSTKCTDTDTGKNVLEAGNTSLDSVKKSDSCMNSSHVLEYYCSNGNLSNATIACPSGYACSNGACKVVAKPAACSETDTGKDVFIAGKTTKGNVTNADSCKNSTSIIEYYCLNDSIKAVVTSCPAGYSCSNGACSLNTTPVSACHDSDGKSYFVTGAVFKDNKNYEDICIDIFTLEEQVCENGNLKSLDYVCPTNYECYDGRCAEIPTSCTDTDNGKNAKQKGVTVLKSGPTVIDEKEDVCVASNKVAEFYCVNSKKIADVVLECGKDEGCKDGVCVSIAKPCEDTDQGKNLSVKGTTIKGKDSFTDKCDGADVVEYYCENNDIKFQKLSCPSGQTCLNGECAIIAVPVACTDTDGGLNVYVKGSTSNATITHSDYCKIDLVEYYCNNSAVEPKLMKCPSGSVCLNGECALIAKPLVCTDTDTGQNIKTAGKVSDGTKNYSDHCVNKSMITEYYCDASNIVQSINLSCPFGEGCFQGQCEMYCTDTDAVKDITVKGTIYKGIGGPSYTDYCIDSSTVMEYYCEPKLNTLLGTSISCPAGQTCSGGKCS